MFCFFDANLFFHFFCLHVIYLFQLHTCNIIFYILNINRKHWLEKLIRNATLLCFKMFKYIRIIFLGVTFLFCKSVNGKHIIKITHATCYKFHNTLDK